MFEGQFQRQRKVNLGGRIKIAESRDQTLERVRIDRERRRIYKRNTSAAITIQSFWRSHRARRCVQACFREEWKQCYRDAAIVSSRPLETEMLARFIYFFDVESLEDAGWLSAICQNVSTAQTQDGRSIQFFQAACNDLYGTIWRASRLTCFCLEAFKFHTSLSGQLLTTAAGSGEAAPLPHFILQCITPETWTGAGLTQEAAELVVAHIMATLLKSGLFLHIYGFYQYVLIQEYVLKSKQRGGPPLFAEVIATALTVKYLSLRGSPQFLKLDLDGRSPELEWLLRIPFLYEVCPSLSPIKQMIWHVAVSSMTVDRDIQPGALCSSLLQGTVQGLSTHPHLAPKLVSLLESLIPQVQHYFDEDGDDELMKMADGPDDIDFTPMRQELKSCISNAAILRALVKNSLSDVTTPQNARALCRFFSRCICLPGQRRGILIGLAISGELVQRLWLYYIKPMQLGDGWVRDSTDGDPGWMSPLNLFSDVWSELLLTTEDEDFYERGHPLPLHEIYDATKNSKQTVLGTLSSALWYTLWTELPPPGGWPAPAQELRDLLVDTVGGFMARLYKRNCRRAFAPQEAFCAEIIPLERILSETRGLASVEQQGSSQLPQLGTSKVASRAWRVLQKAPYLIPFKDRAAVFQAIISSARREAREAEERRLIVNTPLSAGIGPDGFPMFSGHGNQFVTVQRGHFLDHGSTALSDGNLKGRVRIHMINEQGLEEAGVDGGGIFKEYLEGVIAEGFNPESGLFDTTPAHTLYPSPNALLHHDDFIRQSSKLEFLGKMVGKALWEGILIDVPLAGFFLKKFRGALCDVDDLFTLDPELYRHVMSLRKLPEGEIQSLGLFFTTAGPSRRNGGKGGGGGEEEIELVPGGGDRPVSTKADVLEYIHRLSDYRLNKTAFLSTAVFLRGLHSLIPATWLQMFPAESELQALISGDADMGAVDLADMKVHVQYSGGYHAEHAVIQLFWNVMESLSPEQHAEVLKFVTSCPRPPLLGFSRLDPPICIAQAGSVGDARAEERLPTAATCMNLLKLPPYSKPQVMREKLLYAVSAGAGFELS